RGAGGFPVAVGVAFKVGDQNVVGRTGGNGHSNGEAQRECETHGGSPGSCHYGIGRRDRTIADETPPTPDSQSLTLFRVAEAAPRPSGGWSLSPEDERE